MEEKVDILRNNIPGLKDGREKVDAMNELSWLVRYERGEEGEKLGADAAELSKKLKYSRGRAYGKLNQAVNMHLRVLDEEVISLLMDALDYFDKHPKNEEGYSQSHTFLARVHDSYGDYDTALKHAQLAVDSAADMDYKEGEGDALTTLGLIHNRLCDFTHSLPVFKKGMEIRKELGNHKALASSLNLIARTYLLSNDLEQSMNYYQQSLELREKINDISGLPWTYIGMASLQERQENYDEAIQIYEKSLELNEGHGEKRLEFLCMLGIGKAYLNLGDIQNADHYLHKAMEFAEDIGAKPLMVDVHNALGEYYESAGKLDRALAHLKRFHEIEKEVNSLESRNSLKNQQIVFATEQSRKEAEIFQLRNVELKAAFDEIEEKNSEINASIKYAERIQRAVLPPDNYIKEILPEHFILFMPRDIVSGDYYWVTQKDDKIVFTAADCTGHGIPGAFMSMLGISYLNEIVNRMKDLKADKILNKLRKHIMEALRQEGREGEQKDGMDMGLCIYDQKSKLLQFAGAYNSMYLIKNEELEEVKADRMPISIHYHGKESFTNHEMMMEKGDVIYLFSDGFPDQFGGPNGKKYMYKKMKELLLKIHLEPLAKQREMLLKEFEDWKGELEQVDDIIIMGIRF
jgi:serine phosphatase RsbU (regulator of sigma subunit)